ncbi:hypothetical protein BJX65DRAFT_311357 [Aspergillus insuetus]
MESALPSSTLQSRGDSRDDQNASTRSGIDEASNIYEHATHQNQHLNALFSPFLEPDTRHISVSQVIEPAVTQFKPSHTRTSSFEVASPRYSLSDAHIAAIHPPPGGIIPGKAIPHIVFKNPHLPWERTMQSSGVVQIPWLALWIFREGELLLPDEGIFQGTFPSDTRAVRLPIADLLRSGIPTPLASIASERSEDGTRADFIFVPRNLFDTFTYRYESRGSPSTKPQLEPYGYLTHVRHIDTPAIESDPPSAQSVILANRVGPLDGEESVEAIAHLVSLEGLDTDLCLEDGGNSIAVCSLYSWSFGYSPQVTQRFTDDILAALRDLDDEARFLQPPPDKWAPLINSNNPVKQQRLGQLLRDGYTLMRHRTQTGEVTSAFQRGPLTPTPPESGFKPNSLVHDSQTELQVFDHEVGMFNISFETAWTLGKATALADSEYASALIRLRHTLSKRVLEQANRDGSDLSQALADDLYDRKNELRADWKGVLSWFLDVLSLSKIPPSFLVMEPASLPQDSVRFFYIDAMWIMAFLDGAMSFGNHMESDRDTVKAALKLALTRYLETGNTESNAKPEVSISGCLIRSSLVEDQPDLAITAPRRGSDLRPPIVKRGNLAPDVLMILFDRELTNVEFPHGLKISQAPHQQTFVVSNGKVTADTIDMVYLNPGAANCETGGSQTIQEQLISGFVTPDGVILPKNFAHNVHEFWKSRCDKQLADAPPSSALLAHHFASRLEALHLSFPDAGKGGSNLLTTLSLHSKGERVAEDVSSLVRVKPVGFATKTSNEPITSGFLPSESQYTLHVYALAYPSSQELSVKGDSRLPHDAERPLDLVFRLQRKATENCAVSSLPDKVSIHIPSSPSSSTNGPQTSLLREYNGPGPTMVSNLRYIAAMSTTPGELVVTLVPRMKEAADTDFKTNTGRDLSFLLPKIRINAISETLDMVFPITAREYYADMGGKGLVVSTTRVRLVDIGHLRSIM